MPKVALRRTRIASRREVRDSNGRMSELQRLLVRTSRTFALTIPLLPEPCRRQVSVAYLLFRVADTFEDAAHWPQVDRLAALRAWARLLRHPSSSEIERLAAAWKVNPPCDHSGYQELLAGIPGLLSNLQSLPSKAQERIVHHALRTVEGMAAMVAQGETNGDVHVNDFAALRAYCYTVAGIVGELLTELFLLHTPSLAAVAPTLYAHAVAFGEGLQLVNILKDVAVDAQEGRAYLPTQVERPVVFNLARDDLRRAVHYVEALRDGGAPRGMVAFTHLPVLLAEATLDRLERFGPGAKLSRAEVVKLMSRVATDIAFSK